MLFDDLERLDSTALKTLLREVDMQTLVMALRGVAKTFVDRILEHVSQGKAQIVREELELSEGNGGRATMEAQRKVVLLAKRLEREGQITIPQIEGGSVPTARYGLPGTAGGYEPSEGDKGGDDGIDTMRERFKKMINRTESTGTGG
jgi:hypothetical protein